MLSGSNNSRVVFPEAPAEFITERKEGLLEGTRIVPASEEATTCSGNKSILPSWLLLDPDSLWAFEYKYGEGSSPGIVPAGSTKVKWKAWKLWRHESHIHTDWCRWSKAKTHLQPDCGAAKSHWFWIFRVDVLIPSLPRRKLKLKGTQPPLRWSSESETPGDSNPCLFNLRVWPAFPVGLCSSLSGNNLPTLWAGSSLQQVFHLLHILWSSC